jgi:hypothetical protein
VHLCTEHIMIIYYTFTNVFNDMFLSFSYYSRFSKNIPISKSARLHLSTSPISRVTRLGEFSCLLWAVTSKLQKYPTFLGYFIQGLS